MVVKINPVRLLASGACIVFTLFGSVQVVRAQFSSVRIGAISGLNFADQSFSRDLFVGGYNQKFRTGFTVSGLAEAGITDVWSVRAALRFVQKGTRFQNIVYTGNDPLPAGTTEALFRLDYAEVPVLLKAMLSQDQLRPFFFFGPSINFNSVARIEVPGTHVRTQPNTSTLDIGDDVRSTELSLEGGVGVEFTLAQNLYGMAQARYSRGVVDVYDNSALPSAQSNGIAIEVGLLFDVFRKLPETITLPSTVSTKRFEPPEIEKDSDRDGLYDNDEIQKYHTDPYKADTDGDGLTDGDEVLKYHTDPLNKDTDGDGLIDGDEVLKYHTDPLNKDTDRGGMPDGKEVQLGLNPLDPGDDVPQLEGLKLDVGKAIILEGIQFKTASAEITPASATILEKAFNTFEQNPEIVVEIRGHTDNVGKRAYNMKLSQARAKAVKNYLIQRGVSATRMQTKGFGFDQPVASNDTPEGRQKNRRIEFYRIK